MMEVLVGVNGVNGIDANIPPAQDSPQHILNSLDDFCIQTIFRNVTKISDFVNASEVCTRFQENAKQCFPLIHKTIYLSNTSNETNAVDAYRLSLNQQRSLLQNFGHLIYEIRYEVRDKSNGVDFDCNLFESVVKFCGNTLIELTVHKTDSLDQNAYHSTISFDSPSQFPALKLLHLEGITVDRLLLNSSLEQLTLKRVKTVNFVDCIRFYPKLLKFAFQSASRAAFIYEQMDSDLLRLLEVNPQILNLNIRSLSFNLKDIYDRTSNIETFVCDSFDGNLSESEIFVKLKNVIVDDGTTDEQLILLATHMPNLETILMEFGGMSLSSNGISKVLKLAKNLQELRVDNMDLDGEEYHSILRSIKSRAKPCVVRVDHISDVPENVVFDPNNLELIEFNEFDSFNYYLENKYTTSG